MSGWWLGWPQSLQKSWYLSCWGIHYWIRTFCLSWPIVASLPRSWGRCLPQVGVLPSLWVHYPMSRHVASEPSCDRVKEVKFKEQIRQMLYWSEIKEKIFLKTSCSLLKKSYALILKNLLDINFVQVRLMNMGLLNKLDMTRFLNS